MAYSKIDPKDPYGVKLSPEKRKELASELSDALTDAYAARSNVIGAQGDIDYCHFLYEQGRTPQQSKRWRDAADLQSWIVTESVDALRARIVRTIFTKPVYIVEGWGQDAQKAAFAEEFHQWQIEQTRLQGYLSKAVHNALLEGSGILEVIDRADIRLNRQVQQAMAQLAQDGTLLLGEDGQPQPALDEKGALVPVQEGSAQVEVATEQWSFVRKGPGYRIISMRDFLFLPGHAQDKADLWGRAKRCYVRLGAIQERAKQGYYDKKAVEALGTTSDRAELTASLERQGDAYHDERGANVEKELWEVQLLKDCDGDGIEEWYLVTLSVQHREILRIKRDDMGVERYLDFTPFPRSDSVYGYNFVLDKLSTIQEEHTSLRNMIADRSNLATNPPILRHQNALWDPALEPFGTGGVITVRSKDELTPITIPDVPVSAVQRESVVLQAAERLRGVNDSAVGVQTQEQRTLGEVEIVAQASAVRTEEVIKNIQEPLETLWLILNEIWIRTLAQQPQGMEPPERIIKTIESRIGQGALPNGRFTADTLRGNLRGQPRGSVETADPARVRADIAQSWQALVQLAGACPPLQLLFQDPGVAKVFLEQWARAFNVPDLQPFLQAMQQGLMMAQQQAMMQQQMMAQGQMQGQGQMMQGQSGQPPSGNPLEQLQPEQLQQLMAALPQMSEEQLAQLESVGGVQ